MRLLPILVILLGGLALVKAERLAGGLWPEAQAQGTAPAGAPRPAAPAAPPPATPTPAAAPAPEPPEAGAAERAAERAVLEALRARRAEIEAREGRVAAREQVLAAAERRLTQRIEDLSALQARLEALERDRVAREEAGLRGLVKLYEGMRPRDAATIFNELDMAVLTPIMDRMREAKAAPVLGAMQPDRARALTAELAKLRAERLAQARSPTMVAP